MASDYVKNAIANERVKSPEQRAEDIAYTVNHAVSCGTLDLLGGTPFGAYLTENFLKKFILNFKLAVGIITGFGHG